MQRSMKFTKAVFLVPSLRTWDFYFFFGEGRAHGSPLLISGKLGVILKKTTEQSI